MTFRPETCIDCCEPIQQPAAGGPRLRCEGCSVARAKARKAEYMAAWFQKTRQKSRAWREKNKRRAKAWRTANADRIHDYNVETGRVSA